MNPEPTKIQLSNYDAEKPKILFIIPRARLIVGSVYKYSQLFNKFANVIILRDLLYGHTTREINSIKPDFIFIMGDRQTTFTVPRSLNFPYYMVEQDVASMRSNSSQSEEQMIRGAKGIIFTSSLHENYIRSKYDHGNTVTIPLMPLKKDLNFIPKPQLDGKNLVFAGSIMPRSSLTGAYGYRYYLDIFKEFIHSGWNVHIYPAYAIREETRQEYAENGCIIHRHVKHAALYAELSQYQIGFHGYNKDGVASKAFGYTQTCLPNKTYDYFAAGIFTVSLHGGYSGQMVQLLGGKQLKSPVDINSVDYNHDFVYDKIHNTIDTESNIIHVKKIMGIEK